MERLFNGVFLTSLTYQQMADWHDVLASRIILLLILLPRRAVISAINSAV